MRGVRLALIAIGTFVSAVASSGWAQDSLWVRYGQAGRLIYQMDHRGDRLLDYSAVGYKGGQPIPSVADVVDPSRFVQVSPITGDNRSRIQSAINQVAAMPLNEHGYRGVVQFAPGRYDISNTLQIGASGVILRGAGDGSDVAANTVLRSTSTYPINLIEVGNFDQYANDLFTSGSPVNIVDEVVPAGVTSFRVASTAGFQVGDWINVKREPTQAWFDLVTSHFSPPDPSGENYEWNTSENRYTFQHERQITRIEGDRVFIHAPLSHSIDPLSNGTIERYTDRRVSNVGIAQIRGDSVFNANETGVYSGRVQFDDEDHADSFIRFFHAEDSWARGVTGEHLINSTVAISGPSIHITVEDAKSINPVSIVTGSRRYAFNMNGGQLNLMHDLEADSARHAFVNNSTFNGFNRGPNVFYDGVSTNTFARSGPHARYSTGALYDNLSDDNGFEARRAFSPIEHGWRGANTVIWNSESPVFQVTNPPGANNYLIGATGSTSSPNPSSAIVDSFGARIRFDDPENPLDSLYVAQKLEQQRFAHEESREYWIGDFDELQAGDAADQPLVDPAWLTAIDSLSSSFHSSQPVTTFDDDAFGRRVPFTIDYELAEGEEVKSAVLTIGMKRRGGDSSDDDLLWLDSTSSPLSFATDEWGPVFEGNLQVLTLELLGDLSFLQDGRLNGVLSNNRPIDWVHLIVNVGPVSALAGDFNSDGVVDAVDYAVWRSALGSTTDLAADANGDNVVDADDYLVWRNNYGATELDSLTSPATTPEPSTWVGLLMGLVFGIAGRSRASKPESRVPRGSVFNVPLALYCFAFVLGGVNLTVAAERPNIVLLLADDLGWMDVGYHGSEIRTPHIDALTESGVELDSFYVQPTCSPTRIALMTGRYPFRCGGHINVLRPYHKHGPPLDEQFLPEALQQAGYKTAITGKWHLGLARRAYWPTSRGFDLQYGHLGGAIDYFTHEGYGSLDWSDNDNVPLREEGYATDLIGARACVIIGSHPFDEQPLLLYVPFNAPHTPRQAKPADLSKYDDIEDTARRTHAAMVTAMDRQIGAILKSLAERGVRDDTLVFFASDNGGYAGAAKNDPLRGHKGTLFEGGVRVPACVSWPGRLAAGRVVSEVLHIVDLFPTLVGLAGGEHRSGKPLDGVDVWATIEEGAPLAERDVIHNVFDASGRGAIRRGDWKLIVQPERLFDRGVSLAEANLLAQLYRISEDPCERHDLAAAHPQLVQELWATLKSYGANVGDSRPYRQPAPADWTPPADWSQAPE